jgi:hydrogenase nickel incorporation protein HypA/HybF
MHELALATGILEAAEAALVQAGDPTARVRRVRVRLGEFAGVQGELLANAFELARAGTSLAKAELAIERVEASFLCLACRKTVSRPSEDGACPACGARRLQLQTGRELDVVALELEEDEK